MVEGKTIRVAQIMGKLWAGGVEAVVFNYYRAIDKDKIQFDFYYDADSTMAPPQDLIDMGARFFKITPYQNLIDYLKTLRRYFRENKYTIVHSHINTLSVFPLFVAWLEHIPVRIAHNHSVPGGNEVKRNALKYFLKLFAKVFPTDYFACSEKAGRWIWGDKSYEDGQVLILNNAINFQRFKINRSAASSLKKQLGIENKFVIGHVGRFTYAKNHQFLISVFAKICQIDKDAVLLLVGDGELHHEIVELLEKQKVIDKTVMVGKVPNPEQYYGLIDVMVLPSVFEGLPLTVIESQAAGVPVVVSEAIPEEAVISNGCFRIKLSDGKDEWVKTVRKVHGTEVVLNEKSRDFDIKKQASRLSDWYLTQMVVRAGKQESKKIRRCEPIIFLSNYIHKG